VADTFKIAVVGSGPAGLSAAAHAAEIGVSHILLEAEKHFSNTIHKYQKGKHVMATPDILPLRSDLEFEVGSREAVLGAWDDGMESLKANVRCKAEVTGIAKNGSGFVISLKDGSEINAEHVVLSIGVQGNVRKLGVDGQDQEWVQYQLDDPEEYEDETIVVVGAGDAAIENAVALSPHNNVIVVNRKDEFARAKDGNRDLILKAIDTERIGCYYNASPVKVEATDGGDHAGVLTLSCDEGEVRVPCDRIIARIGAIPPRRFVEACGIEFPNAYPTSVPAVSPQYESNVPGLYIVGALAGYPLIKQCMNQGYEVVEYIEGNQVAPADESILEDTFSRIPGYTNVDDTLTMIQESIPVLSSITALQLREFLLDSRIVLDNDQSVKDNDGAIFQKNEFTNSFFTILDGGVKIPLREDDDSQVAKLGKGEFFGEMSLLSGRRRSATVYPDGKCVLIETPRRTMVKLISSVAAVKRTIDETFIIRAIQSRFAPDAPIELLDDVVAASEINNYKAGETLFLEGEDGDRLHLIRSGSVTISRSIGGRDIVLAYVAAGNYTGEMALLGNTTRSATVTAAVPTETISLTNEAFQKLLDFDPKLKAEVEAEFERRTLANLKQEQQAEGGDIISFLMQQGLGEATDVLLIDESLCVRCDNCETACAETHDDGISRLLREFGPTFAMVHVPTSCRHCEHPHCMKDCPPDAIHRHANGEVYIEDSCIGCGNCERNCPYDVIHLAAPAEPKPGLVNWLMFGTGPGPGEHKPKKKSKAAKKAVKCDMCKDLAGGPACVRACPTGAAIRISPEQLPEYVNPTR